MGFRSSWLDIPPYSMSAVQWPDGPRRLFAEDNLMSRMLMYRDY